VVPKKLGRIAKILNGLVGVLMTLCYWKKQDGFVVASSAM